MIGRRLSILVMSITVNRWNIMIKNKPLPFKKFLKLNKKATNSVPSTAQEAKSTMVSLDGQERH